MLLILFMPGGIMGPKRGNSSLSDVLMLITWCAFQDLTVTDDTVLEEHNEDPRLVQMRLIGDGGE
jgi:hypothetical protein